MSSQPAEHDIVTLTEVQSPGLAEVLQLALRDAGIECAIEGELQAGLTGLFPIRLLVARSDLEQARQVLENQQ